MKALRTLFNLSLDAETHGPLLGSARRGLLDAVGLLVGGPAPDDGNEEELEGDDDAAKKQRRVKRRKEREAAAAGARGLQTRPSGADSTPHLCALLLHVLTTNRDNHGALVEKGAVALLVTLAGSPAEATKTAVAGSLYNLTQLAPVARESTTEALMVLARSSENARVLWCAWCFANVSTYPKGRAMLGRLSRTLVPTLLAMMRSGCADAERIQYRAPERNSCKRIRADYSKRRAVEFLERWRRERTRFFAGTTAPWPSATRSPCF